jgi:hypothetical protein
MTGFFNVMPAKLVLMSRGTAERREEAEGAEAGVGVSGALEFMISSALIFSRRAVGNRLVPDTPFATPLRLRVPCYDVL